MYANKSWMKKLFLPCAVQFPYCFKGTKILCWPLYSILIPVPIPMLSFTPLVTKPFFKIKIQNCCYTRKGLMLKMHATICYELQVQGFPLSTIFATWTKIVLCEICTGWVEHRLNSSSTNLLIRIQLVLILCL